ncbi:MAG: TMEM165/GDT1 family protein [Victivallales bacterium]|nr:TMEM165/GDT1 family protein [Victivallales bacterium]
MNIKLFLLSFSIVFLAELGDKTQLAALSLSSSGKGGIWTVFFGASAALVCSTALACLCSSFLDRIINPKYLNIGSSLLFIIIGAYSLAKLAWTSTEFTESPKNDTTIVAKSK